MFGHLGSGYDILAENKWPKRAEISESMEYVIATAESCCFFFLSHKFKLFLFLMPVKISYLF